MKSKPRRIYERRKIVQSFTQNVSSVQNSDYPDRSSPVADYLVWKSVFQQDCLHWRRHRRAKLDRRVELRIPV